MTRGVRIRLAAFAALAAVGVMYVTATYLGVVDKVLGRGLAVHATLPDSGGLFVGSEVTYRGVKVGKVSGMEITEDGLRADLALAEGTKVPEDSLLRVHNLSAVGEQYLDIVPQTDAGPYLADGATLAGDEHSLPTDEGDLLVDLDRFVNSVDTDHLNTVISELGTAFRDTAHPLQRMVDSGDRFLTGALAAEENTFALLENGQTVLETQAANGENISSFARDLADLTGSLKAKDPELREVLEGGSSAVREVDKLMKGLEPTLPVFIGNLVTLNQITTARLDGLEQLLVTFPRMISSGFTGTPGDGYGHINLQLAQSPGPCRDGYRPATTWRGGHELTDEEPFPARCNDPNKNFRGSNHAPAPRNDSTPHRVAPYDPATGAVEGGADLADVLIGSQGGLTDVFGDDSWRWMLIGPLEGVQ